MEGYTMTTRTESRSDKTRETKQRRTVFEEPNWLEIPASVITRFLYEKIRIQ